MNNPPPPLGSNRNREEIRALFLCGASRTYGEINGILPLARNLAREGGDVWFLGSPLAAQLARADFPDRVFEMVDDRTANQHTFWRMVKKFRPNVLVFTELYEILQLDEVRECSLIDWKLLQDLEELEVTRVFVDFIAHTELLREVLSCPACARQLGRRALRLFLERMWVMLPCPLNEPGPVAGRRGIPYRLSATHPARSDGKDRARCRLKYLGKRHEKQGILILRGGSTWQADLADQQNVHLHEYFTDLLALYLDDFPKPVTLVSVSDGHKLRPPNGDRKLKVVNVANLPPDEYQALLLSADLVLTDNEISYSLGHAIGNTPSAVLVNSYTSEELFQREGSRGPLGRLISEVEAKWPGSIYPHAIFPIRLAETDVAARRGEEPKSTTTPATGALAPQTMRLSRMPSSPFIRAELYGGKETKELLRRLLLDASAREELIQQETAYLERLSRIEDGMTVLKQIHAVGKLWPHKVM